MKRRSAIILAAMITTGIIAWRLLPAPHHRLVMELPQGATFRVQEDGVIAVSAPEKSGRVPSAEQLRSFPDDNAAVLFADEERVLYTKPLPVKPSDLSLPNAALRSVHELRLSDRQQRELPLSASSVSFFDGSFITEETQSFPANFSRPSAKRVGPRVKLFEFAPPDFKKREFADLPSGALLGAIEQKWLFYRPFSTPQKLIYWRFGDRKRGVIDAWRGLWRPSFVAGKFYWVDSPLTSTVSSESAYLMSYTPFTDTEPEIETELGRGAVDLLAEPEAIYWLTPTAPGYPRTLMRCDPQRGVVRLRSDLPSDASLAGVKRDVIYFSVSRTRERWWDWSKEGMSPQRYTGIYACSVNAD